ncbi:MAG: DEAD/DEAH box helicase [Planctomycetota bacterium]
MSIKFDSLELSQRVLDAVAQEGYERPTPIQAKAIPSVLAGRDILGCAQTGTGKTAAFALPVIQLLHAAPADKSRRGKLRPRALVLSPTRELAAQIDDSFKTYAKYTSLKNTVIYGGVKQFRQVRALDRGVDILTATPGRLLDLMEQGHVDLREIEYFVLDEADRMLDMGFIEPIRQIARAFSKRPQTLMFSATMPGEIMKLADQLLRKPVKVSVDPVASAAPLIDQSVCFVAQEEKLELLKHMLRDRKVERALVFSRTKYGADKLAKKLNQSNVRTSAIHGDRTQGQRERALSSFRNGSSRVLVATDVAARGLDVDNITHVFNFDLPMEAEAYVHRIGRTGRAGAVGVAVAFCSPKERGLLKSIERLLDERLDRMEGPAEIVAVRPGEESVVVRKPRSGASRGGGKAKGAANGKPRKKPRVRSTRESESRGGGRAAKPTHKKKRGPGSASRKRGTRAR